ncbi:hypothetical protein SCHPADRAFT_1725 [Schizopora paradoxa]|uniref:F-box domain-containing protein n=1 Tax=Schizopora paradoxa TaxID=27342 RepID=A0A0H2S8U7_9AGAM|nr:hypothetical protein SCHPADRAFT_1725 [Schizopora paradoxa]
MSLVHRSWTHVAQRVMQRHVKLHSYSKLNEFWEENLAGNHVRGLSYVYTPHSGLGGNDIAPEAHWKLLADVLSQCPNIQQLSIKSIFRFLSRETEYEYWCRDRHVQDLPRVFTSIKSLTKLDAWVFDVDLRIMERDRIRVFSELCAILPDLRNLKYLQTIAWRENSDRNGLSFLDRSPPPSLKKLALHVASPHAPVRYLKWLLRSQGEYCLDELVFHRPDWLPEHESALSSQLHATEPFKSSQRAEFIYEPYRLWQTSRPTRLFTIPIINLLSSLRDLELHCELGERSLELPRPSARNSIESLTVCIGQYAITVAQVVDRQISPWVDRQEFPNLRQFRIRGACLHFPPDLRSEAFPRLSKACDEADVSFVTNFEANSIGDLYVPLYLPGTHGHPHY